MAAAAAAWAAQNLPHRAVEAVSPIKATGCFMSFPSMVSGCPSGLRPSAMYKKGVVEKGACKYRVLLCILPDQSPHPQLQAITACCHCASAACWLCASAGPVPVLPCCRQRLLGCRVAAAWLQIGCTVAACQVQSGCCTAAEWLPRGCRCCAPSCVEAPSHQRLITATGTAMAPPCLLASKNCSSELSAAAVLSHTCGRGGRWMGGRAVNNKIAQQQGEAPTPPQPTQPPPPRPPQPPPPKRSSWAP